MNPDPTHNDTPLPGLIRIVRGQGGVPQVAPPKDVPPDSAAAFGPFRLPPLPLSLHCWLSGFAGDFFHRHQRCIAALLVLDCQQHRWLPPVVPAQACGAEGASWTLDLGDDAVAGPAHRRVGGSFQTRRSVDVMEAAGCVPRLDGLHLVQSIDTGGSTVFCFLRERRRTSVLLPGDAVVDDWGQALAEASGRMTFE